MNAISRTFACAMALIAAWAVHAAEPRSIEWNDLLPEGRIFEDPFETMSYEQLVDLSDLLRLETLPSEQLDEAKRTEAAEIRAALAEDGLDPDWLFEQRKIVMRERKIAATQTNQDVVGQTVRMPGYLLPLEMVDGKAVEFLLVPTVGACIHVPPPPPNQIIHVQYPEGFEIVGFYDAVWITGEMRAESARPSLNFVDGVADVDTSYSMDAVAVESYR